MMDILRQIEELQKDCQKSRILTTDIELSKKITVGTMENGPYPGGHEEKLMNLFVVEGEEGIEINPNTVEEVPSTSKRRVMNFRVSTKRCWSTVRNEVVLSCKEFLSQRLDEDQKGFIDRMNTFIDRRSSIEIIQAVRIDVENLFGVHSVSSFTDDVISLCAAEKLSVPP